MARERTVSIRCAEDGCRDHQYLAYATQREYGQIQHDQRMRSWKCSRHRDPLANLRPGNESTHRVLVATRVEARDGSWLPGLYWRPARSATAGSGFISGPGFNAYASDFPEGTRLVVTTQIEGTTP
jgi:hypothetical protein